MLQGGQTGLAVVLGKPEESLLIETLRHESYEMPPEQKLPRQVINDFVTWIKLGAPDPRRHQQPGVIQQGIDMEQGRKFWVFQPIGNPVSETQPQISVGLFHRRLGSREGPEPSCRWLAPIDWPSQATGNTLGHVPRRLLSSRGRSPLMRFASAVLGGHWQQWQDLGLR